MRLDMFREPRSLTVAARFNRTHRSRCNGALEVPADESEHDTLNREIPGAVDQ